MAFTRPTLTQIRDRIESDFVSGLGLSTILERSFLKVMANALSGASHTLHGHIQDFAQKQLFPDTADAEFLVRWANIFGIVRNQATFAQLNITVTGTESSVLSVGTLFQRSDGAEYSVDTEATISGGSATTTVTALEAGDDGNISDGSTITLTAPVAGIDSSATVDSTAVEGEDIETIEALRTRLIERIQQPPAGGKVTDYIAFAKTVTGVTRVWVLPAHLGQGTVGVSFVEDDEVPIIPSAAKVAEVQTAIDELKPVTADVTVFAPTEFALDPTIQLKPNTTAVQAAVQAELEDLIFREAQVRGAVDPEQVGLSVTFDGKIPLSKINEAISIASGEDDHILVSPSSTPQPPTGGIITLGTITFQTLV